MDITRTSNITTLVEGDSPFTFNVADDSNICQQADGESNIDLELLAISKLDLEETT